MKQASRRTEVKIIPLSERSFTDPEIAEGVVKGDPFAGEALVARFGPIIDRRVWRLMGRDSEHKDVVQQVFKQVVQNLAQLEDRQALEAWVGQVTVSVVRKELRRRRYRWIVGFSTDQVERWQDREVIEHRLGVLRGFAILNKMRPDHRIAFALRYIEGMTLREVARITSCSLATAKRRIRRARDTFLKKASRDSVLAPLVSEEQAP